MSNRQRNQTTVTNHIRRADNILSKVSAISRFSNLEILISLIYPLILVIGQLIYLLSPSEQVDNYFTSKRNLFNVFFVKNGWGWTMVAFGVLVFKRYSVGKKIDVKSLIRLFIVTFCWILYTQWFFGPPLMDKIFVFTGGKCYNIPERSLGRLQQSQTEKFLPMDYFLEAIGPMKKQDVNYFQAHHISSQMCRSLKGSWHGGHDPSGHVFLLTLSSIFLLFEIVNMKYTIRDMKLQFQRFFTSVKFDYQKKRYVHLFFGNFFDYPLVLVLSLVALWLWMLLMTSIYFHSLFEKFTGLIWSYISVALAYVAPRYISRNTAKKH